MTGRLLTLALLLAFQSAVVSFAPPHGQYGNLQRQFSLARGSRSSTPEEQARIVNIGKTIDTLREDTSRLLDQEPDLSVYANNIRVSDPSGQRLQGKQAYQNLLRVVRGVSSMAFQNVSVVRARFLYDEQRSTFKAKMSARVRIKGASMLGDPGFRHFSIVSSYHLVAETGLVSHHKIDRVEVDGTEVEMPFAFLSKDSALDWLVRGANTKVFPSPGDSLPLRPRRREPQGALVLLAESELDVYGNVVAPSKAGAEGGKSERRAAGSEKRGSGLSPFGSFIEWLQEMKPKKCKEDWECPKLQSCCDIGVARLCCGGNAPAYNPAYKPVPVPVDDSSFPPFPERY